MDDKEIEKNISKIKSQNQYLFNIQNNFKKKIIYILY